MTRNLSGEHLTRAVQVDDLEGPASVRVRRVALDPADGDTRVRVAFAGVSMPDILMSKGLYQQRHALPFTLGCEFAGVVEESRDASFPVGSRVVGLVSRGAFADVARANGVDLLPVPDAMSLELAAAIPVNYLTMHYALHDRGRIARGDRVLVRGAGGGIGIAALQLANAAGAAHIVAIASTEVKRRAARDLGADLAVATVAESDPDAVGFDIVVDPVGGDDAIDALRTLRQHGRYLIIGFASGGIPSTAFNRVLLRNIDLIGVYLGFRRQTHPDDVRRIWDDVCRLAITGEAVPLVDSVHPLDDAAAAMQIVERRQVVGKVLLRVAGEQVSGIRTTE